MVSKEQCPWCHQVMHDDRYDVATSKCNICTIVICEGELWKWYECRSWIAQIGRARARGLCFSFLIYTFVRRICSIGTWSNLLRPGNVLIRLAFYHMLRSNKCVPSSSPSSRVTDPSNRQYVTPAHIRPPSCQTLNKYPFN